jgi:hypothetical protein
MDELEVGIGRFDRAVEERRSSISSDIGSCKV